MTLEAVLALIAAFAVLARSIFSASDAAFTAVSPERAAELVKERSSVGRRALVSLKKDPEGTAATVRGGAVTFLAVAAALGGVVSLRLLEPHVGELGWLDRVAATVLAAAAGGLVAAFSVFLVDLVPRSLAIAHPEPWAERLAIPVRAASVFVSVPARLLRAVLDRVLGPLGAHATFKAAAPALEDIERFLEAEARGGDEDAPPLELIRSIFEFPTKIAKEVMVPRTRVVGISIDASPEEVMRLLAEEGHSRMPVYRDGMDEIVGVLHARDLVPLLAHPELIKLPDVIRPPVFVPWATRIGHLLREMQRRRIHMAMVTDEYGGCMGIVTLEDILEEIVGDIKDEHDEPEPKEIEAQPDGTWLVSARVALHTFNQTLGASVPEDEGFETLAGFLNSAAGEIPDVGATIQAHGLTFTITDRSPKRVRRVRVAKLEPRSAAAGAQVSPPSAG